jgi:hypothetical protein
VGNFPWGLAFDGANVWVANFEDETITAVHARHGTTRGTFRDSFCPLNLGFGGGFVWAADSCNESLTLFRRNGEHFGRVTLFPEDFPANMAFDGNSMWVIVGFDGSIAKVTITPE